MHTAPQCFSAVKACSCRSWGTRPKDPLPVVGNADRRKGEPDQCVAQTVRVARAIGRQVAKLEVSSPWRKCRFHAMTGRSSYR